MCDACRVPSHVPIYTISIFTGEQLCLCLDCVDNRAEPLWSIIHGTRNGALDHLPHEMKRKTTIYSKGRYIPMRTLAMVDPSRLIPPPAPAPKPPELTEEEASLVHIMRLMKAVKKGARDQTRAAPSLLRKLLDWALGTPFGRSASTVRA